MRQLCGATILLRSRVLLIVEKNDLRSTSRSVCAGGIYRRLIIRKAHVTFIELTLVHRTGT